MFLIIISFIVYLVVNFLGGLAWEFLLVSFFRDNENIGLLYQIGCHVISILIAFPLFMVMNKMNVQKTRELFHTNDKLKPSQMSIIIMLLLACTVLPIIIISAFTNGMISDSFDIVTIIWLVLITPFIEEIIFRGVILQKLSKYGAVTAVLITTVLFSVGHMNIGNIIISFIPSIILCTTALKTNSIKYTVPLHILVNATAIITQMAVVHF